MMADTIKKRGRVATKKKEAKSEPTIDIASEAEPIVAVASEAEPLKGKGKRKNAPVESVATGKKVPVGKKVKSDGLNPPEDAKVAKDPKEPKAARKNASNGASVATKNGSEVAEAVATLENGLAVDKPTTTKRNRGKPSYKEEDLDEPEYVPKPSKSRAKSKAKENIEEKVVKEVALKKKPADKAGSTQEKEAITDDVSAPAKPAARGRKKALDVEATTDDAAAVGLDAENITKRKPASKRASAKETEASSMSVAVAKSTARGRKKLVDSEETTTVAVDESENQRDVKEVSTANNEVTQRKRGKKKVDDEQKEAAEANEEPPKVKKAKVAAPKMNKCVTDYGSINFELEAADKLWNFKISSWNLAGLRSWVGKGGLEFLEHERPDILCVQETKCTEDQMPEEARHIPGYHPYWLCKPGGYAGVAIYSKKMPIHVTYGLGDPEQDQDGRLLTAEYEKFYLVCVYVPNAGNKLVTLPKRMRWDEKFHQYLADLNGKKPVILCGDMNVAHEEIDLANPKTNRKNAGFTQEERDGMTKLLSLGFVDTFRRLYPDRKSAYTFWTYMGGARAKNVGWRLDYFIVSERLIDKVTDNVIRSQVYGSDHCPLTLFLNI